MFTLPLFYFCSYSFMICNIRMMSVWRMLQNARHSSHITPSPGQTDRQLSVSGHALMCCVSVWPHEAPLSQSEARMVTHWPIRGQDWADHDTDAVMSGVMRGEAVTRSKCQDRNTNTPLNCPSERGWQQMRKTEVMQRVDPTCQHREKHPIEREIYSACSRLFLRGYTHTQRLLGSLFVHSEHFAKLDRNENGFKKQKKYPVIIKIPDESSVKTRNWPWTLC